MSDDRDELRDALRRSNQKDLRGAIERSQQLASSKARRRGTGTLLWQGPWRADIDYKRADVVSHKGSSWRALADHKNSEPPSRLWEYVAKRGDRGEAGKLGPMGPGGIGMAGPQGPVGPPGPGSDLEIEDESVPLGPADTMDFAGAGVSVVVVGTTATVTIPGAAASGTSFTTQAKWD